MGAEHTGGHWRGEVQQQAGSIKHVESLGLPSFGFVTLSLLGNFLLRAWVSGRRTLTGALASLRQILSGSAHLSRVDHFRELLDVSLAG